MLPLQTPRTLGSLAGLAEARLKERLGLLGWSPEAESPPLALTGPADTEIKALAAVDEAGPGVLTFAVSADFLNRAREASAAAVIVPPGLIEAGREAPPALLFPEPRLIFAVLLDILGAYRRPRPTAGEAIFIERGSVILGRETMVAAGACIGRGVKIGDRTVVGPGAVLEDGVEIGRDCLIHPRAVLRWGVRVGHGCQIHSGAVIGEDGFGYSQCPDPLSGRLIHYKNEHLGGVVLEDDVEVGANACIDRGLVADTVIGRGSKIDNLVQIGHNCRLGRDCLVVSQVGVGGHSQIGDRVFLLGQAGLGPGVTVGQDAVLSAQSGLGSGRLPAGRRLWSGTPAKAHEENYRLQALGASQLPKARKFFQLLKKSLTFDELRSAFLAPEPGKKDFSEDKK
ncbi:MAG: UDP-3-O-(3-hydroxymyristoyl)glucosamine N-acyltransferase [Candidatus Adiutrix sp.]|jgi:UDP-3-O-[3-hydroxymyristoyl] glucosamine N-acyltransferase|nr:UDP-3-O-(3-hydroxymyristoyl)glucosamine N-acyltransferase [Candidatus Adiutrix sp.]